MADIQSLQRIGRRVRARIDRLATLNEILTESCGRDDALEPDDEFDALIEHLERQEAEPSQYLLNLAASGLEVVERLLIDCEREMGRQIKANVWLERRWSEVTERLLPTSAQAETTRDPSTKASQVDPHTINLPDFDIDAFTLRFVPRDLAVERRIIPVQYLGSTLVLAMQDPQDTEGIETVKFLTGRQIEVVVASSEQIQGALARYYPEPDHIIDWIGDEE